MKRAPLLFLLLFVIGAPSCWATSKLPPTVPVMAREGRVIASLKPLIADTNDVELKEASLCQRYGNYCFQVIWRIQFYPDFKPEEFELFKIYPGAKVYENRPAALMAGGSYVLRIHFHERGWKHKQTVASTSAEFCLIEISGALQIQDESECIVRRNLENRKKSEDNYSHIPNKKHPPWDGLLAIRWKIFMTTVNTPIS